MAGIFRFILDKAGAAQFAQNWNELAAKMEGAFTAAMNMAASMMKDEGDAAIAGAGNFGSDWADSLHIDTEGTLGNMRISMTLDDRASLFATGGQIRGNPLLWIPLSGTDAVGTKAAQYGEMFSVNRKSGGVPLLFSVADKKPKYFGIESVTIPQKFRLDAIQKSVMANFRTFFDEALKGK